MTATPGIDEARDGRGPAAGRWTRIGPVWAVLLVLTLVVVAMVPLLGSRTSSYADLRRDVRSGSVGAVEVTEGLGAQGQGYATVQVSWRGRVLRHSAEVVESRSRGLDATDGLPVLDGTVESDLRSLAPDVEVVDVGDDYGATLAGWTVPEWLLLASLALWLAALVTLRWGPAPLRATRWGWFWVMTLLQPLGVLAYLVLGRPGPLRDPAPDARQLTGGWSFLLTVVVLVPLLG